LKLSDPSQLLPGLPERSKILIVRLRSLGDLVLETPAISGLREWRPDLQISVLVEPRFAAVFEGNREISEIISSGRFSPTVKELRRREFSVAYNQHGGPRSALLTAASGANVRVGWKGYQFSLAYNVRVPDVPEFYGAPIVHAVEHRISQFYATGLPRGPIPRAQVFPQADALSAVRTALAEGGLEPGTRYAVLQPGARLQLMRWPLEKFASVAAWLREEYKIISVVNLGPGDAEIWAAAHRLMRHCILIPRPLALRELIALIAEARIFVGNDSGPIHIAAAAGRPIVALYGPTNPAQWHPWQAEYRAFHTGALFHPTRGDKSMAESEPRPIASIMVEEVVNACDALLREN